MKEEVNVSDFLPVCQTCGKVWCFFLWLYQLIKPVLSCTLATRLRLMATIKAELTVRQNCMQAVFTSRLADPGQKYSEESL